MDTFLWISLAHNKFSDVHGPSQVRPRDAPSLVANAPRLLGAWRAQATNEAVLHTLFLLSETSLPVLVPSSSDLDYLLPGLSFTFTCDNCRLSGGPPCYDYTVIDDLIYNRFLTNVCSPESYGLAREWCP